MAEVFYHKEGAFGRRIELHVAPEGLTLVGQAGPGSVEYAPLDEISSTMIKPTRR